MRITFDVGFKKVNIFTVQADVAILGTYSMFNGKIHLQLGTSWTTTSYDLSENSFQSFKFSIQVLFNLCLVYMLLVATTQLAVSKENIFEALLRPNPSFSQRKRNQHHLGLCQLQKMLPTCIFNELTTNSSCRKKTLDRHSVIPTFPIPWDIDGQILMDL